MEYKEYITAFRVKAKNDGLSDNEVEECLKYAKTLFDNNVPVIYDQLHFSYLVGYDFHYIIKLSNSTISFYNEFSIPKKNGSLRTIDEPMPSLKEIQTWILKAILIPASKTKVSPVAKAFMPKIGLKDNAKFHRGQKKLLCIDLVDFFGSISFGEVYAVFKNMGYSLPLSTMMSNLTMLNDSLPQGAPTSPMLSNLVFKYYDDKIFAFCTERKIRYTRYADDLAFSGDFNIGELLSYITHLFKGTSFRINEKKTKVASQGRRQEVTGIVVNQKIQVPKDYRKEIRQCVYYMIKFGLEAHTRKIKWDKSEIQYIYHLLGKVNFILQINPKDENAKKQYAYLLDLLKQNKH